MRTRSLRFGAAFVVMLGLALTALLRGGGALPEADHGVVAEDSRTAVMVESGAGVVGAARRQESRECIRHTYSFTIDTVVQVGGPTASPARSSCSGTLVVDTKAADADGGRRLRICVAGLTSDGVAREAGPHALFVQQRLDRVFSALAWLPATDLQIRRLVLAVAARGLQFPHVALGSSAVLELSDEASPFVATVASSSAGPGQSRVLRKKDRLLPRPTSDIPATHTLKRSDDAATLRADVLEESDADEAITLATAETTVELAVRLHLRRAGSEVRTDEDWGVPGPFLPAAGWWGEATDTVARPPTASTADLVAALRDLHARGELQTDQGQSLWNALVHAFAARPMDVAEIVRGLRNGTLLPPALAEEVAGRLVTALVAACRYGSPACEQAVVELIGDPNGFLRRQAILGVNQLPSCASKVPALRDAVLSAAMGQGLAGAENREEALLAVGTLRGRVAERVVDAFLTGSARDEARGNDRTDLLLSAYGNTMDPRFLEVHVVPELTNPRETVRVSAVEALSSAAGSELATAGLERALASDAAANVRAAAARALGAHGADRAIPRLCDALERDPSEEVRLGAIGGLTRHLANEDVRAALERGAGADPSPEVRRTARAALRP